MFSVAKSQQVKGARQLSATNSFRNSFIKSRFVGNNHLRKANFSKAQYEEEAHATLTLKRLRGLTLRVNSDTIKTGLDVWDGALLLIDSFHEEGDAEMNLSKKKVLELGAGTGAVGLALAAAGAEVVLTDGSDQALTLLRQNVNENTALFETQPRVERLRWGVTEDFKAMQQVQPHTYDFIVASECVYGKSAGAKHEDLLGTIQAFSGDCTRVLMSYTLRPVRMSSGEYVAPLSIDEVPFFTSAAKHFKIHQMKQTTRKYSNEPKLFIMTKR